MAKVDITERTFAFSLRIVKLSQILDSAPGIACKESRETLYWLRLLIASSIMPSEKLEPLKKEADELVAILTTIIKNSGA